MTNTSKSAILATALKRFNRISAFESENRQASLQDMRFVYNVDDGQWDANVRNARLNGRYKRPCLTVNKLRKFLSRVAGVMRDSKIGINVVAGDAATSPELVTRVQSILTQIEYDSDCDRIYADAGEQALAGGWAYWRILTKYVEDAFEQIIQVEPIENPFNVYLDEDRRYCFIKTWINKDDFKIEFPKAKDTIVGMEGLQSIGTGEDFKDWFEEEKIQICEYFERVPAKKYIMQIQLADGSIIVKAINIPKGEKPPEIAFPYMMENGEVALNGRVQNGHKIIWRKITAFDVLEERDWPGQYIPVVEVVGDKVNIQGKVYKRGLIRDVKDLQMIYNYFITANVEKVALTPKAPYLVTPQELMGFENMWEQANDIPFPYLFYNAQGTRVPRRENPGMVDAGAAHLLTLIDGDIKDVLGQYDASIGAPSNERTGRAIMARRASSDIIAYRFHDNLSRAMLDSARIIIDLIPFVYDTPRVINTTNERGELIPVTINTVSEDTLRVGRYKLVTTLKPYNTRREETVNLIKDAMQYAPQLSPVLAPLLFKFMDAAGSDEILKAITAASNTAPTEPGIESGKDQAIQELLGTNQPVPQ